MGKSLCEIERELSGGRFLRCHRSYIVNMDHITGMDNHFVLDTGDRIVVTQRFMAAARVAVVQYYKKKKAEMVM